MPKCTACGDERAMLYTHPFWICDLRFATCDFSNPSEGDGTCAYLGCFFRFSQSESEVRAVVIDMSAITRIDYTGILALEYALDTLKPGVLLHSIIYHVGEGLYLRHASVC